MQDSKEEIQWVREVIERTRFAFLVSNLASLIVLVALFNTYASWMNHVRERADPGMAPALIRSNVSDLMISSVPILGLKIFGGDLGILSAIAMLVLSVWLYYAFRREQHSVARLILKFSTIGTSSEKRMSAFSGGAPRDVSVRLRSEDPQDAEYLLWALSTSFLFTTSKIDRAIGSSELERYDEEGPGIAVVAKSILVFAPVYVVLLVLIADAVSLFLPSLIGGDQSLWLDLSDAEKVEVCIRLAVSASIVLLIVKVLRRAAYFAGWTQTLYRGLAMAVHTAKLKKKEFDIPWADEPIKQQILLLDTVETSIGTGDEATTEEPRTG